jgi:hypothetical protein
LQFIGKERRTNEKREGVEKNGENNATILMVRRFIWVENSGTYLILIYIVRSLEDSS